jgi:hypothetical protein
VKIVTTDQRTQEWLQARVGQLTGTCAGDMLATIKTGEAAARRDLRMRLVCERLTGQSQEDAYVNAAMQRGIDKEADAFAAYEALTGELALPVGYLAHDSLPAGCSPDGEVGNYRGILELKCPKTATHVGYLRGKKVPIAYLPQITHNLWVTGAEWCDFFSFDDRLPDALRCFCVRLERNDVDIKAYELMVRLFLKEIDAEVEALTALAPVAA